MLAVAGLAVVLFVATNLDDLFVLIGFLSNPKYRLSQIVIGQYLGIAVMLAVSMLLGLVSLVLERRYVGLLGLLPIAIGGKKLFDVFAGNESKDEAEQTGRGNIVTVVAITVANGGDNIGVYAPVVATSSVTSLAVIVAVFAIMVALWIGFSFWLVNHPSLGAPLRRYGHLITPVVLVVIGASVLYEAGSLSLLAPR
jgi:cadmium resistance protein CadD (predicted permease)